MNRLTITERPFDIMKFTLTYDGELASNGSAAQKWTIRHKIHPQLAELWATNTSLRRLRSEAIVPKEGTTFSVARYAIGPPADDFSVRAPGANEVDLCVPLDIAGRKIIPLIRGSLSLACALDILFLREEDPWILTKGGDIDNRIKTLFDGLRMPSLDDMRHGQPQSDPLYCLLEEDSLVSNVSVRTARLLTGEENRPDGKPARNFVRLIIEVTVIVTHVTPVNVILLGA